MPAVCAPLALPPCAVRMLIVENLPRRQPCSLSPAARHVSRLLHEECPSTSPSGLHHVVLPLPRPRLRRQREGAGHLLI